MGITQEVISYIIRVLSGKITKTQLVKLLFLADWESVKHTGLQITDIKWRYYHYGPYDDKFDKRLSILKKNGIIQIEKCRKLGSKDIYFLYRHLRDFPERIDPVKKEILETILRQFGSFTLESLLKYVYETEPMKIANKGEFMDLRKMVVNELVLQKEKK